MAKQTRQNLSVTIIPANASEQDLEKLIKIWQTEYDLTQASKPVKKRGARKTANP